MLNPHFKNTLFFGSVSPLWEFPNTVPVIPRIEMRCFFVWCTVWANPRNSPCAKRRLFLPYLYISSQPHTRLTNVVSRSHDVSEQLALLRMCVNVCFLCVCLYAFCLCECVYLSTCRYLVRCTITTAPSCVLQQALCIMQFKEPDRSPEVCVEACRGDWNTIHEQFYDFGVGDLLSLRKLLLMALMYDRLFSEI